MAPAAKSIRQRAKIRKIPYTYKGVTHDRWLVTWRDLQNNRCEERFPNKRFAEDHARKMDRQIDEGIHVADRSTVTFRKAWQEYEKYCEQRMLGPNRRMAGATLEGYRVMARNNAVPWFGDTKLNKITSRDVQAYVDDVATRYKASSCRRALVVVWNVLKFAVDHEWLVRNPLKDKRVELPPLKNKSADDIPSFEVVRDLLIYLHGKRHPKQYKLVWDQRLPMVALAGFGGLRAGECCALDWNCVDLVKRTVKIDKSFSRIDGMKGPKSDAGNRVVPMNPILHNIMVRYAALVGMTGPVFRNSSGGGGRRNYDSFGGQLRKSLREAKLAHFNFHALRHFAGSAWLAQGMRIQDVSWLLGHSEINFTIKTYAHQLKGDDHARQVLNEQVTRFPGVPHSLVASPVEVARLATSTPALLLEASTDGDVVAAEPQPIYQPSPQANVAPIEVVPTIEIPPEAPQWVGYAVKLLQSGWMPRDVAAEVNYDPSRLWRVFKNFGLPGPDRIRLDALWARAQYMKDNGRSHREIARVNRVTIDAVSRMVGRRKRGGKGADRSNEKRPPRMLKCQTCGKEYAWDKAGADPMNCVECRADIARSNKGRQRPLSPNPRTARVRHLRCEKCGSKFDWNTFGGANPKTCPGCKSENEAPVNTLLTKDNLPLTPAGKREKSGENQLTLWKS